MMKKLFLMTVAMFCAIAQDAWADNDPITYIERSWDEVNKRVVETEKTCYSYTLLSGNHSDWQGLYDGWYVVKDANVTYQTLNVLGNAHLILCDGAEISLTGGMKLEGSRTLTIYGQKGGLDGEGSGTLDATNTDYDDAAGIGSAAIRLAATLSFTEETSGALATRMLPASAAERKKAASPPTPLRRERGVYTF